MLSRRVMRSALVGAIGTSAMAGAMLFAGASLASGEPTPAPPSPAPAAPAPGCTAADLAQASGTVGTAMGVYLFTHPDVNNFFTGLRGLPNEEIRGDVQNYMNANPRLSPKSTGSANPSPTWGIAAITTLIRVNSHLSGVTPVHHFRHRLGQSRR